MHKFLSLVTILVTALNPLSIQTAAQNPSIGQLWQDFKTSLGECVTESIVTPITRIPNHLSTAGHLAFNATKDTINQNKGTLALAAAATYTTMRYIKNACNHYEQVNQLTRNSDAITSLQVRCFLKEQPEICFISEQRNDLTAIITALERWFTNEANGLETTHLNKTLVMQITVELQRPVKSKKRLLKTFEINIEARQTAHEIVTYPTLTAIKNYLLRRCTTTWNSSADLCRALPNENLSTFRYAKITHTSTINPSILIADPKRFIASEAPLKLELLNKKVVLVEQSHTTATQEDEDEENDFKNKIKKHLTTLVTDDDLTKTITIEISYRNPQTHLIHFLKPITFTFNGKDLFQQHQYNTKNDEQYTFKNYFIGKRSEHYIAIRTAIVKELFSQHIEPLLTLQQQEA